MTQPVQAAQERTIVAFEDPESAQQWVSVNDGVMGGISEGGFAYSGAGSLLFSGVLSLENNGGFASIRTRPQDMELDGMSGVKVRVRGDGRTYWLDLRAGRLMGAGSFRANLPTSKDEWTETIIPLEDFQRQVFGRIIPGETLDPAGINSVGFTLADKKAGPFALEIEYVRGIWDDPEQQAIGTLDRRLTPAELIQLAITRGVPLFNDGDPAACAAVYEVTCQALRIMPEVAGTVREMLDQSIRELQPAMTDRERAWALRRALDQAYASLTAEPE